MYSRLLFVAAALSALPAFAHDFKVGDLTVDHPMAFETAPGARVGGGFFTVTNAGDTADRLIRVEADFPRVEIHETVVADGIARMQEIRTLEIPPGGTVELAPGGLHVMFMGLNAPLTAGDVLEATLVFERAGPVEVAFDVEKRGGQGEHGAHATTHGGEHDDGDAE